MALEDIHDPHNAGAILRTAEGGLGIAVVHFLFLQEPPYNPRRATKGTAMSAQKWLDLFVWRSREELLAELKAQGFASWCLVAQAALWRGESGWCIMPVWLGARAKLLHRLPSSANSSRATKGWTRPSAKQ